MQITSDGSRFYSSHMVSHPPRPCLCGRPALAALLIVVSPAVGRTEESVNRLRLDPAAAASESLRRQVDLVEHTELVPLPQELSPSYGSAIPLISPISRSAGLPGNNAASRPLTGDDFDDQWVPRGGLVKETPKQAQAANPIASKPPTTDRENQPGEATDGQDASPRLAAVDKITEIFGNTLQAIRDLPARNRESDSADQTSKRSTADPQDVEPPSLSTADEASQSKDDGSAAELILVSPAINADESAKRVADVATAPEAAESPESTDSPEATDSPESSAAIDSAVKGKSANSVRSSESAQSATPSDANGEIEIRKLKLSSNGRRETAAPNRQLNSGKTVDGKSVTGKSVTGKGVSVGDLKRTEYHNPIRGDRITDSGELILATGKAAANLPILPQTARLKSVIERGLHYYWDNPEDAAERTHWGMMHAVMVFDRDTHIVANRRRYNAVAWMAGNNPCRNQLLFDDDRDGIVVKTGVGVQGHQGQLLAIFGQINVPKNYPLYSPRNQYTIEDVLHREMRDCRPNTELTFTLIALAHYADSDTTWVSGDGQRWSVERLIQEELDQPVVGSACGGTHRLMGFAHALRRRRAEEKPITGQWDRAERYLADFDRYIWTLQNRDGSMSTAWFEQPQDNGNLDRKIQTTGHMLELLMLTTPDAELQSPKMLRTVGFLANALYNERGHRWQVGPKGHALRSVAMYYQRIFGDATPWRAGAASESAGRNVPRAVR